jgi:NAD(P)-dependent dehydrogenase (short-subunit alcohol dehydrogenase family)
MEGQHMFDFKGQVALVTGAAAGIGFGVAQAFHEAGASIAVCDFREATLTEAAKRFGGSADVFAHAVDVRDPASVAKFVEAAEQTLGPVTIAVANAGIYPNTPVLEMTSEEWDRVIETNLRGVFLTCQAVARSMVAHGTRGKIITISSGAYQSGRVGAAHYCASKAGVVMFTKVLALEMASHKINVNCIAPGLIEVNSAVSPISQEYTEVLTRSIPWGRIGRPEDIAQSAMFLASPMAEFVTGEVLSVNGGSSAGRAFLPLSTPRPESTTA